jgi:isoleucyl-tRNA synthetase
MLELDRWAVDRAFRLQEEIVAAYRDYQFHLIYQKVHNFCVTDMGGFYLDVIKDRQYTTQRESLPRRSCQTALYHIAEALVRWLAPILSFTAEEIWQHLPGRRGETVLTEVWYPGLFALDESDPYDRSFWDRVLAVRGAVGKHLEQARKAGAIGAALDAEVDLWCDDALRAALGKLGDELRFVLITSYAHLHALAAAPADASPTEVDGLMVRVSVCPHAKCVRCWHHRGDVGADASHPQLCGRCVENVAGSGEIRKYA